MVSWYDTIFVFVLILDHLHLPAPPNFLFLIFHFIVHPDGDHDLGDLGRLSYGGSSEPAQADPDCWLFLMQLIMEGINDVVKICVMNVMIICYPYYYHVTVVPEALPYLTEHSPDIEQIWEASKPFW